MTTLYREIDALGGNDNRGYSIAINDALEILTKRGFTEQSDATPPMYEDAMALIYEMARVSHTSTDIDHYDEAKRIHDAVTPVDEDLIEARKIAAVCSNRNSVGHADYLLGACDTFSETIAALAAIKRGRELAEKANG